MPSLRVHHHLTSIAAEQWDALRTNDYPFLSYAFLNALEQTQCVGDPQGWHPLHLTLEDDQGELMAAMPMYLKSHSWGEYVFDGAWQEAWERAGFHYFPKLVTSIPFTPASGERFLFNADVLSFEQALEYFVTAVRQLCHEQQFSGWHGLFIKSEQLEAFKQQSLIPRMDCQYHWYNRGYQNFDDFLATFTSRKRKNLRKERARIQAQEIELKVLEGAQIRAEQLDAFFEFYQLTYLKHGMQSYLNKAFFQQLLKTMPDQILLVMAYHQGRAVAGAWSFKDRHNLYGRYWGCDEEFDSLHFETCYYQGIDYCIAHGLSHFDPGAQGEHKIQRGFEPIPTWSVHWIDDPQFRAAVAEFTQSEQTWVEQQMQELASHLPFHQS
ncbi:GNAT family N-acetyltransferase [Celerinatantimonas sp. YJH-8]|uniref:GNAT family N-acetyltransferase n=1 Tax=Celerinatantimonas sp. YJH-8 TaxID=3228714 RepID=UPI0038C477FE